MLIGCSYPKSESQRINALVEERGAKAACDFVDRKLQSLKSSPYPKSVEAIRQVYHSVLSFEKCLGNQRVP